MNRRIFDNDGWDAWWDTICDQVDAGGLVGIAVNAEDSEVALTAMNFALDADTQELIADLPEYGGLVAVERAHEWTRMERAS